MPYSRSYSDGSPYWNQDTGYTGFKNQFSRRNPYSSSSYGSSPSHGSSYSSGYSPSHGSSYTDPYPVSEKHAEYEYGGEYDDGYRSGGYSSGGGYGGGCYQQRADTRLGDTIALGALVVGAVLTYILYQAIQTNLAGGRRRKEGEAEGLFSFLWNGKELE